MRSEFLAKGAGTQKIPMKTPFVMLLAALGLTGAHPLLAADPPRKETGEEMFERGRKALYKGDLPVARQCFEQLLKAKPEFELARIHLAQVAMAERELAKIPQSLKV